MTLQCLDQSVDINKGSLNKFNHQNYHDKFNQRDRSVERINKSMNMLNSQGVNDKLRTRPTQRGMSTFDNPDYIPSIQKYNRKGKLY